MDIDDNLIMTHPLPEPAHGPDGLGILIALVLSIPLWGAIVCGIIWWTAT